MTEQPGRGTSSSPRSSAAQWPRRAIASYDSYAEAERAVDHLADMHFPVEHVAIVGRDLETIEQVTGRMDYPRSALRGALSGAVPGALIGWIFGLLSWVNPLIASLLLALYGLIFGAILGAVVGIIVYALQRGRRDFASVTMMQARRFEVLVDDAFADEATKLLGLGV